MDHRGQLGVGPGPRRRGAGPARRRSPRGRRPAPDRRAPPGGGRHRGDEPEAAHRVALSAAKKPAAFRQDLPLLLQDAVLPPQPGQLGALLRRQAVAPAAIDRGLLGPTPAGSRGAPPGPSPPGPATARWRCTNCTASARNAGGVRRPRLRSPIGRGLPSAGASRPPVCGCPPNAGVAVRVARAAVGSDRVVLPAPRRDGAAPADGQSLVVGAPLDALVVDREALPRQQHVPPPGAGPALAPVVRLRVVSPEDSPPPGSVFGGQVRTAEPPPQLWE